MGLECHSMKHLVRLSIEEGVNLGPELRLEPKLGNILNRGKLLGKIPVMTAEQLMVSLERRRSLQELISIMAHLVFKVS